MYTINEATRILHCHPRTLAKWIERTGIVLASSDYDKRKKLLTGEDLERLRRWSEAPPTSSASSEIADLRREIEELRRRVSELEQERTNSTIRLYAPGRAAR